MEIPSFSLRSELGPDRKGYRSMGKSISDSEINLIGWRGFTNKFDWVEGVRPLHPIKFILNLIESSSTQSNFFPNLICFFLFPNVSMANVLESNSWRNNFVDGKI